MKSERPEALTEKSVRKLEGRDMFEANAPSSLSDLKSVLSLNLHPKSIVEKSSLNSYHKLNRFNLLTHSNSVEKIHPGDKFFTNRQPNTQSY